MLPEIIVRILFATIFFSVLTVGLFFRHKAQKQKDRFNRMKNEGPVTFLILRLCGFFIWGVCFLYPFFPKLFVRIKFEQTPLIQWIGILFASAALPMGVSVFRNLGKNITDTVETRKDHELVTSGIYRYIRHPLYTTGFLFFFGLGLLSAIWLILFLSIVVLATLYSRTFTEEQNLIEEFGGHYTEYMNTTGKFIPKFLSYPKK